MSQPIDPIDQIVKDAATPKFCKDCKFLLGRRSFLEQAEDWRCTAEKNILESRLNLVTGTPVRLYVRENLEVLRNDVAACGPAGNWYEEYKQPSYAPSEIPAVKSPVERAKEVSNSVRIGKERINLTDL